MTARTIVRRFLVTCLTAASLWTTASAAEPPYTCGTGTLLDVEVVTETIPTASTTVIRSKRNRHGRREERIYTTPSERQETTYVVTIQLDDMRYVGQSSGNNFWDFDPTRLVINDPVGVCIDRNRIVVQRPDGKSYKAKIVRAARGN